MLTFHLDNDLCIVFTLCGVHMTPVSSSVLESTSPDDQCSVAVGYQGWVNGDVSGQLLVVLFSAVFVAISSIAPLKCVHHDTLSEPLNGFTAARTEAAGEHAFLRHGTHHSHV